MVIEQRGIHGRFRKDHPHRALRIVLYRVPQEQRLAVTFQQEQIGGHYIVREQMKDGPFSGQYLNTLSGEVAMTPEEIRAETLSTGDQVLRYHERHKDQMIVAFAGAGNTTMNPRFVVYADGRLAYTDIDVEKKYLGKPVPGIVVGKNGKAKFHGKVALGLNTRNNPVVQVDGKVRTRSTACAVQGPCLVRNGKPIDAKRLSNMAQGEWFYDLRHIIQFPFIRCSGGQGTPFEIDVGLETLWLGKGKIRQLDKARVANALAGEVLDIDLTLYTDQSFKYCRTHGGAVGIDAIESALKDQSYSTDRKESERGWYRIDRRRKKLYIRYHHGTFNHSILGMTKGNEEIRWLGLAGLGGRVGVTMVDAAKLAVANGLHNAILIDNGGDVMFNHRGEWVVRSGYDRTRIRGLLLFVANAGGPQIRQDWLPLNPI